MNRGPTQPRRNLLSWITGAVLAAACLAFGAALSGYAATGANMRYSGDDYCYSAVLAEHGFWQTQTFTYLSVTTYAGNRFSVNLVEAASNLVGPLANAVLPALILVLWIGGMALFLRELSRGFGAPLHLLICFLAAGGVIFFVLHNTPNLSQSFYWSSGLITYPLPLMVNSYLAALVLNRIQSPAHLRLGSGLVLVFSFFAAGFSETVAALQVGIYGLALASAWIACRRPAIKNSNDIRPIRTVWLCSAALLGTLIAMAVLALSPANHLRQSVLPHPPDLLGLVRMSLYNAYIFTRISISKGFWQLVLCTLFFLGLSCLFAISHPKKSTRPAASITGILACLAVGYIGVVCTMAPSVYAESSYPDLRVLIVPWWIFLIETGGVSWLAGQMLAHWLQPNPGSASYNAIFVTACLAVLAICALPLSASFSLYKQLPRYQRWAYFWDMRNAQIWQASRTNQGRVEVMQIDHIIQDVSDLSPNPAFWYNVCAARYYGVKQIAADLPGWDK